MTNELLSHLPQLLPLACQWAEEQERQIIQRGVSLTPQQVADARQVGVLAAGEG